MITINYREYAWGDITVTLFGQPVAGLRGISYKTSKEKGELYAAGRNPRAIQHGKRKCDGTLTITQSELQALNRSAQAKGYNDILDVDFNIVICYISDNAIISTDIVKLASISELPQEMKEGDLNMEIALPFIALGIDYNVL